MQYFTIEELCHSETARRLHIDNRPTPEVVQNLTQLVEQVLDPARAALGQPLLIGSGYRCPQLNRRVGGATTSQHLLGQAADIVPQSTLDADMLRLYELLCAQNNFDQLILERCSPDRIPRWIHVSWSLRPRHQRLINYALTPRRYAPIED